MERLPQRGGRYGSGWALVGLSAGTAAAAANQEVGAALCFDIVGRGAPACGLTGQHIGEHRSGLAGCFDVALLCARAHFSNSFFWFRFRLWQTIPPPTKSI